MVLDALGRLAEQVSAEHAGAAATRAAMERSAVKGMAFESLVGRAITDIAASRGDIAEPTGTTAGGTGGRVGDFVVEVADGGTYVLECKDRLKSLTAILAELDVAAANREAAAAIAVFSSPEHCPVTGPIAIFDDRVIVVYDKHDPDPAALTLACTWARAAAIARSLPAAGDGIDLAQIRAAVETARDALTRVSVIRRAHTGAARKITEAGQQLDLLTSNVSQALAQVDTTIAASFNAALSG